jgi:hypothetical protein
MLNLFSCMITLQNFPPQLLAIIAVYDVIWRHTLPKRSIRSFVKDIDMRLVKRVKTCNMLCWQRPSLSCSVFTRIDAMNVETPLFWIVCTNVYYSTKHFALVTIMELLFLDSPGKWRFLVCLPQTSLVKYSPLRSRVSYEIYFSTLSHLLINSNIWYGSEVCNSFVPGTVRG